MRKSSERNPDCPCRGDTPYRFVQTIINFVTSSAPKTPERPIASKLRTKHWIYFWSYPFRSSLPTED
ncbi:MAG TPA: hypothetical protein P5282_10830, partial [Anaerolineaceae bacterium]|nr:hypothetical protein [Anaerolineaceae bacterium]